MSWLIFPFSLQILKAVKDIFSGFLILVLNLKSLH